MELLPANIVNIWIIFALTLARFWAVQGSQMGHRPTLGLVGISEDLIASIFAKTFHLDLMGRDLRAQKCQFLKGKTQIKTSSQNLTDIFLAFEVSSMA